MLGAVAAADRSVRFPRRGHGPPGVGPSGRVGRSAGCVAGIAAAVAAVWAVAPAKREAALPPEFRLSGWVVDRPEELAAVVRALGDSRAGTVGITTGLLRGRRIRQDDPGPEGVRRPRVRRRFGGGCTGDAGPGFAGSGRHRPKVNDVIKLVAGEDASFTDPQLAGQHLGSLSGYRSRRLLVLDDVWEPVAAGAVYPWRQAVREAGYYAGPGTAGRARPGRASGPDVEGSGPGVADRGLSG